MRKTTARAFCVVCVVAAACSKPSQEAKPDAANPRVDDAPKIVDYHNGLSDSDRETFYHLTEGSAMIPLALLQALEPCGIC